VSVTPVDGESSQLDELLDVLGRERVLLENLVFRLIEARGLLATGEARFLGWAASDIEAAADSLREVEMRRATIVGAVGATFLPSLAMLVELTREPYASLLCDHRLALGRLLGEVGAALEAAHDLAEAGLQHVRAIRERPDGGGANDPRFDPPWAPWNGIERRGVDASLQPRRAVPFAELDELDREIVAAGYEAVLNATARLTLPSLVAFLS
jgi:hypothetical protein